MTADLIGASFLTSPAPVASESFTGIIAKFTDADKNTDPAQYSATIHWGDGTVSQGTITADPSGGFDVAGTHTFAKNGAFRVTAQIGDVDGDTVSVSTTNVVSEAPIIASNAHVHPTKTGVLAKAVVATFTDANTSLTSTAFSAAIHWGDGKTSVGTVVTDNAIKGFKVVGSHKYRGLGSFSIDVTIQEGHGASSFYTVSNLISDGSVAADHVDPNLVNPWGLAAPNPGDFWDANNGAGTSAVFDSLGNVSTGLPVVKIPAPAGDTNAATPSGVVFNSSSGFVISNGHASGPAVFLFATEDGTIAGWNPRVFDTGSVPSTQAFLAVDNSDSDAVYKGLALVNVSSGGAVPAGEYLLATNFNSNTINVFNTSFQAVTLPAGAFQDPSIPAGYAPFGIQTIGNEVYVTYAKQDAEKHDDVAGSGNGVVDVYTNSGALIQHLGGSGIQKELNSPWAVAQAPANFGQFSNDILVGNFGDSHISAFSPTTGTFLAQLANADGQPLTLDGGVAGSDGKGLWGLFSFLNSTAGSSTTDTIEFSSGFNDENDGLFGSLTVGQASTTTAVSDVTVGSAHSHARRHG